VQGYKHQIINDPITDLKHVDYCWRILIGLGCVPGVVALYFRLTIPETPRFTMDIERNVVQASQDIDNVITTGQFYVDSDAPVQRVQAPKASRRDFMEYFSKWENFKILFGAAYSWFALDVCFFSRFRVDCSFLICASLDCFLWPWSKFLHCPYRYWLWHFTPERLAWHI
jgi:PHS family inorganic phosphate transporter-like MFS transporter